jgi:Spy/CpxP family protein refolding chaperone
MARRTAVILGVMLACAAPASASLVTCDQAPASKPVDQGQGARGADGRDGRGGTDGRNPDDRKDEHRMPWWKAPETRAQLGISDKQSKDIDDIFQENFPSLRAAKEELDKLDDALAKLIKEGTADIAIVTRQVAQAEQARANLTSKRTVMLYRMHRLLTTEQRAKLDAMFAQREAERRKNDPNGRR